MLQMTLSDSLAALPIELRPPAAFEIRRATSGATRTPLVYASPHSGRHYPGDMGSSLAGLALRQSEDALVDELVAAAPELGVTLISAQFARAYMDVNREAFDLDPAMFADKLPPFAQGRSARVAAGLGAIARLVAQGQEIYDRKLTFAEALGRIDRVHTPYHAGLEQLLAEARAAHGFAILIDWHSMPAAAARTSGRENNCDLVLGDRYGSACGGVVMKIVEQELQSLGYRVSRNTPYAGGFTTEHYGRPAQGRHALQIEINRGLYLDEARLTPTPGFSKLKADLEHLTRHLAAETWDGLRTP